MTNWLERAEQERRRLAAEAAARTAEEEKRKREAADEIRQKLAIYQKLGIPEKLEEIRRDIWKGFGTISPFAKINPLGFPKTKSGHIGHVLSYTAVTGLSPKYYESAYEETYGRHTEYESWGPSGPYGMDRNYRKVEKTGAYSEYVGKKLDKIDEANEDYSLTCSLIFSSGGNNKYLYFFSVNGNQLPGIEESPDLLPSLLKQVDQSLLGYAMNPGIPDFAKLKTQIDGERARIPSILRYTGPSFS